MLRTQHVLTVLTTIVQRMPLVEKSSDAPRPQPDFCQGHQGHLNLTIPRGSASTEGQVSFQTSPPVDTSSSLSTNMDTKNQKQEDSEIDTW